jgi:predicted amidohydrolase
MGILILAILIMAIVRILLPMIIIVTTARMREVASMIGYRIAAAIVVSIATMVSIVAVSVTVLRIRCVFVGTMIVIVPWTTVVAAARLKWLVPRRRRHLHDYRTLINALRNSGALTGVYAENTLV